MILVKVTMNKSSILKFINQYTGFIMLDTMRIIIENLYL